MPAPLLAAVMRSPGHCLARRRPDGDGAAAGTLLYADLWGVPRGARGGSHQAGPSPLLNPWIEFCNSPQRGIPAKGLRFGAAPALLPSSGHGLEGSSGRGKGHAEGSPGRGKGHAEARHRHGTAPVGHSHAGKGHGLDSHHGRVQAGGLTGVTGAIPDPDILANSEFVLPLDVEGRALYWDLLHRV